jgi:hypothetical protein
VLQKSARAWLAARGGGGGGADGAAAEGPQLDEAALQVGLCPHTVQEQPAQVGSAQPCKLLCRGPGRRWVPSSTVVWAWVTLCQPGAQELRKVRLLLGRKHVERVAAGLAARAANTATAAADQAANAGGGEAGAGEASSGVALAAAAVNAVEQQLEGS